MKRGATGEYEITAMGGEAVRAFVPAPLPPDPPLELLGERQRLLERALLACGRLDGVTALLPDPDLFLYAYVRREAVLSSQIEGTQSSLSDLLLFELDEAPGVPLDDVVEVSNYVAALEHGMARLREDFPLSNRLLREVHEKLLVRGRGADKQPGEFRRSQNWIGGTRPGNAQFVPPPPQLVEDCMASLERAIHAADDGLPALVKAALAHAQFETIHPFLDGNGRVGRLLISLMLFDAGVLGQPLLYLSYYFKQHRAEYYRLLDTVRAEGDWESWLDFFLEGVASTAGAAVDTAHRLLALFRDDAARVQTLGRAAANALRVFDALRDRPLATLNDLTERTGASYPTVSRAVDALENLGIVREITGRKRERVFAYARYLAILNEGTEPL
ncbi:helix-turn-helix domain-containing protein [Rubrobacter marinus]|uniref:Helix-turn-helix domain-containing protein n=1 Tax=Rubrobacter marinus TaxID=2653852 RepID=A0A6G8PT61_9ACTN|nr:helix-turn-helix domain-containing protein [Rubrobacter marinus]